MSSSVLEHHNCVGALFFNSFLVDFAVLNEILCISWWDQEVLSSVRKLYLDIPC